MPTGSGGLLTQTCWMGPRADAGELFAEIGTPGARRAFAALRALIG